MAFAWAAAVAGAGTVSCTGTTAVTGVGTNFGAAGSAARLGGTIIVGGVTKTITAIASTTSLTTDTAFGTFSGSAYTCQREVVQTGADTMGTGLGVITGFTVTNRGDIQRTFDAGGVDVTINGVLTVDCTTGQLRNNTTTGALKVLSTGSASAELIFTGRKASANNGPFPYDGLDWLGVNGAKIMQLQGTATYPAKLTLRDACIRYGADWITTNTGQYSTITTEGEICWILCGNGQGTNQARLRMDNTTPTVNFTAKKTYVGVWLNFGVPQISLKGYTPLNTDGPEINLNSVSVATRIPIEDYDTTYVVPNYYANSQIVLYGGAWVRLKNNLKGTNINYFSQNASAGARNVLEFSKQVKVTSKDSLGNLLSDGYFYFTPVGSNVAGVRAKGGTSDITFDLSKKTIQLVSGSAETEYVYAWQNNSTGGVVSSYLYFCSGTTRGAETHPAKVSRYGYDTQSLTMTLNGNGTYEYTAVHASLPTTDKVIANAAAITGVTFNFTTKVMTVAGSLTVQQIYDAYQYARNTTANLGVADECTTSNGTTDYVGWTINVNTGVTITAGSSDALTVLKANTITLNGTAQIKTIYITSAGVSVVLELRDISDKAAVAAWNPSTGAVDLFDTNTTGAVKTYTLYYPPGSAGLTKKVTRELYGYQRAEETLTLVAGNMWWTAVDIPDVGITQTTQATVAAYTSLSTYSQLYDYYAYKRLTDVNFIKLGQVAVRDGTAINFGTYSGRLKATNAAVISITGSTIYVKGASLDGDAKFSTIIATPPATWTGDTAEEINGEIEDGNGDSSVNIEAAGISTFEIWKITDATDPDDYATGTLLDTVGIGRFRFLHADGFKMVIRDTTTNFRVVSEMEKGVYEAALFFGAAVQLAQAAEVSEINNKVDAMQINLSLVPTEVWAEELETGYSAGDIQRINAAVLAGKVSGAGTGTEIFRDLNDTKDRVTSSPTDEGNRTAVVLDGA